MQHRREERTRRRVSCELIVGKRRSTGIVLDLSSGGLFVQTGAPPEPGSEIRVRLRDTGAESIELEAVVARRRVVPSHLAAIKAGGIGLRILDPPEDYERFLWALRGEDEPPARRKRGSKAPEIDPPSEPERPEHTFRVRIKQSTGPRSRNVLVSCVSEHAARTQVTEELGDGWSILEITQL